MNFLTKVDIDKFPKLIEHNHSILTIGSCFAENIGSYFTKYKFNSIVNPFGVLYNSESIKNSLQLTITNRKFTKDDLVFEQDEWHSFFHHSSFSHHQPEQVLENINKASRDTNEFLSQVDWVIVTLGTSYVYRHKEKNIIVSNCHKIPQKEFTKGFLSVEQNTANLKEIIKLIRAKSPTSKFIFTVSPIRHRSDGAHNNQLSKASLHLGIEQVIKSEENVFYFPSYEIQIDELRDYRFYARDMFHPSDEAVEYLWERFSEVCLSEKCNQLVNEISKIVIASGHRVRNIKSKKNQEFAADYISKIKKIKDKSPYINFENELNKFYSYLDK